MSDIKLTYLLDSSALMTLIEDEAGAERNAIIAAFAISNQAILIHKDPEFKSLAGELVAEALPYK